MELTKKDVKLLNAKKGLKEMLMGSKKINLTKTIDFVTKEDEIKKLQVELIKLQSWVIDNKQRVIIIFEGRDAAGKGGAIRRFTHYLNPRQIKNVALNKPTEDEQGQWYFQRYISRLPKHGEIVFFDRSWYNRAVVEPVNGFCTEKQYQVFMNQVNEFEKMLVDDDIYLIKFYFSITKEEQARRFKKIKTDPLKKWKMSPVDDNAQELWSTYTKYKKLMFEKTNTDIAPWTIVSANVKIDARIETIKHVLKQLPYKKNREI